MEGIQGEHTPGVGIHIIRYPEKGLEVLQRVRERPFS